MLLAAARGAHLRMTSVWPRRLSPFPLVRLQSSTSTTNDPTTTTAATSSAAPPSPPAAVPTTDIPIPFRKSLVETGGPGATPPAAGLERMNSGIIWFDNLFPLRLHRWDYRYLLVNPKSTLDQLDDLVHNHSSPDIRVPEMVSKEREGGAFVYFQSPVKSADEVARDLLVYLKTHHQRHWLITQEIRSHLVEGKPFIHDLSIYPSKKVRIDLVGGSGVDVETLYNILRKYGKLVKLEMLGGKDVPRHALAEFKHYHGAISSRNCVHGLIVNGTRLEFTYQEMLKRGFFSDFFNKHSRILFPLLVALMALLTYAVFDPIRVFFITNKLTSRFNLKNVLPLDFLDKTTFGVFGLSRSDDDSFPVWSDINFNLEATLNLRPESVIFLAGPTGSGKSHMVSRAIRSVERSLRIDCGGLRSNTASHLHSEEELLLWDLVQGVGYFPSMTWFNAVSGSIEGLLAATTGVKASLSSTTTAQMHHVLECVTRSLISVHQSDSSKSGIARPLPLIVIDNYTSVFKQEHPEYAKNLLDWGFYVVTHGLAHVVFIADNNAAEDAYNEATGADKSRSRVDVISLHDAATDKASDYIIDHLPAGKVTREAAHRAALLIGGRLSDVQSIVQKVQSGASLDDAVEEVIRRAEQLIRSSGFGVGTTQKLAWSKAQIWYVLDLLLRNEGEVSYDEVLFGEFFNGDEEPLRAMQRAELITVVRADVAHGASGTPSSTLRLVIRPGRPVFLEAFRRMAADRKLGSGMMVVTYRFLIEKSQAKIKGYEDELALLNSLSATAAKAGEKVSNLTGRKSFLYSQISKLSEKIDGLEKERSKCEKALKE